ncbi:WD40-repeat-containing domain protein [Dunaliella salina]|uniref:Dynein axonemal intermediate chain 4 n=1 Tax=Dunaliella salina TaxID=3046 RepID=A0ABQ7FY36_DUNSA|nr:WD40-repeat-containing domain protein [Dunaliella salina]|eukprot:KAF5827261.1 WD40-repeat-containing domain protein [Dunaliella salina]
MAKAKQKDAELVALRPHHILTDKDLAKSVSIVLQETQTEFMLEIPSITVAGDSEEAKAVEEANRRYSKLLAAKISTDRYADSETQSMADDPPNPRQLCFWLSSWLVVSGEGLRALWWDIADAAAESSRSKAMQENALGGDLPSVGELAGGVARGSAYAGAQIGSGGGGGQGSSFMSQSGIPRGSTQSSLMRQESVSSNARGSTVGPSWAQPSSMMAPPPGAPPGAATNAPNAGPEGAAGVASIGEPEPPPNPLAPLLRKPAFREALAVMDAALAQNEHQPQLLLYRNITPQTSVVAPPVPPTLKNMSEKENLAGSTHSRTNAHSRALSRAQSRGASRPASRQGSEAGSVVIGEAAAKLQRSMPQRLAGAGSGSIGQNSHQSAQNLPQRESMSQAPSVAESHWPEELLQDLADLGPDGAPAMEHLWDWTCELTEGKQVACMAWNKAIPDLLAVGYGSLNFHKEGGTGTAKDKDANHRGSKDAAPGAKADAKPSPAGAPTANNANANDAANGAANKAEAQNGGPGGAAAPPGKGGPGGGAGEANGAQKENGAAAPPAAASHGGLVAFWSLKNPGFPLWWFETLSGVTALDFSTSAPNILALGLYSGAVAVYDVKQRQGTPSMESDAATGKHSDPVWKVKWIDRGSEHDEPLVSISTDGRVTQWSIAKGLEYTDLMKLKRVPRKNTGALPSILTGPPSSTLNNTGGSGGPNSGAGGATSGTGGKAGAKQSNPGAQKGGSDGGEAFISRLTSGMSFDFSARDERVYIVGTEDGWVHRCSTSYNEQYLESYAAHMGPVYSLQWSPFRKDMFISCSADWTLKMWQEGREQPLLTFQSHTHEVNDVQWCPTNSTVFGSATSGGRLEIWDFDLSTVKPVVTHKAGVKLSCLLFSPTCPVVVCGSESGRVSVFRLFNVDREYDLPEDQLSRLEEVIRTNVMKAQPGAAV